MVESCYSRIVFFERMFVHTRIMFVLKVGKDCCIRASFQSVLNSSFSYFCFLFIYFCLHASYQVSSLAVDPCYVAVHVLLLVLPSNNILLCVHVDHVLVASLCYKADISCYFIILTLNWNLAELFGDTS